mmetsp:Transcript_27370/g.55091  ORF Transcript_27370/g.55091 Transcript_27370/m.55091 type:complete len:313 (-) Transcript_27370:319-1257(-)
MLLLFLRLLVVMFVCHCVRGAVVTVILSLLVCMTMLVLVAVLMSSGLTVPVFARVTVTVRLLSVAMAVALPFQLLDFKLLERAFHALDGERREVHHLADGHLGTFSLIQLGERVNRVDRFLEVIQLFFRHQIDFVEQDAVREGNLADGLIHRILGTDFVQVGLHVLAIHQAHDAIDAEIVRDGLVLSKRRHDRRRVGKASCLDDKQIKVLFPILELHQSLHQVAAHCAARAAVVERDDLLGDVHVLFDQSGIDVDAAKLVFNHADSLAVVRREDVVNKRGFACTKEARHHGDWQLLSIRDLLKVFLVRQLRV